MRLKIVSDGTGQGTRIENADSGEVLERVRAVSWEVEGPWADATVRLTVERVLLDVEGISGNVEGCGETPEMRRREHGEKER